MMWCAFNLIEMLPEQDTNKQTDSHPGSLSNIRHMT